MARPAARIMSHTACSSPALAYRYTEGLVDHPQLRSELWIAQEFDRVMTVTVGLSTALVALLSERPALALAFGAMGGLAHAAYSRWGAPPAPDGLSPGVIRMFISAVVLAPLVWAYGAVVPAWIVAVPAMVAGPLTCRPRGEPLALVTVLTSVLGAHALAGGSWLSLAAGLIALSSAGILSMVAGRVLKQLVHDAEIATRAKSRFLANMSHELRTPLAGVIGLTEQALLEPLEPSPRELIGTAKSSVQHLLLILNDILDVSKIEADSMPLEQVPFDCAALVQQVAAVAGASARGKSLRVEAHYRGPARRRGDPVRLRQILLNLAGNAVKFSCEGVVSLEVEAEGERVRFRVRDQGIGMSAEQQARLFQPFVQADSSIARRFGGTGLGLSISQSLVHAMGGSLSVESVEGRGSTFEFAIVLPEVAESASAAVVDASAASAETSLHVVPGVPGAPAATTGGGEASPAGAVMTAPDDVAPPTDASSFPVRELAGRSAPEVSSRSLRVLLAEDNAVNQLVLGRMLRRAGHDVHTVADGDAALDALERRGPFDVVLMDMQMPGRDGIDATRAIRAATSAAWSAIPVIALTANAMPEDREACLHAGMDAFLVKPVSSNQLARALDDATSAR
jgi:signal transduction histidine kinase/CheY-like chemotaxis protein